MKVKAIVLFSCIAFSAMAGFSDNEKRFYAFFYRAYTSFVETRNRLVDWIGVNKLAALATGIVGITGIGIYITHRQAIKNFEDWFRGTPGIPHSKLVSIDGEIVCVDRTKGLFGRASIKK